jgi:hypothetical protein
MRTLKAIVMTATIGAGSLITGGNTFATDAVTVSTNNSQKRVKVTVSQPRLHDISVSVADEKGYLIYHDNIKAETKYGRVFDLSNLDDGIYTVTSSNQLVSTVKKIKVEGSSTREIGEETIHKPLIVLKDNYLRVQLLNQNQEDIEITIDGFETIYQESQAGNELVFGKMLDVSELPRGEYSAMVKVGKNSYSHRFKIR